jgi:hypothetical protein
MSRTRILELLAQHKAHLDRPYVERELIRV